MMEAIRLVDPTTAAEVEDSFNHWGNIELVLKGHRIRTTGHGFVGIGRKKPLNLLQACCEELGASRATTGM